MIRFIYTMLWWVCMPLALLRLWWRGIREPDYRRHIPERFGFYTQFDQGRPQQVIWVHAVSVGETRAAQPLVEMLLSSYPDCTVLLTHMTATGRETGKQLFAAHGRRVVQSYLPYDTGWMARRFLDYFKPAAGILMETEIWPNLIRAGARLQVPIILANARLSERSYRKGRRFSSVMEEVAQELACIAAQSEPDANRLRSFGATNVHVTGSIKFDVQPPQDMVAQGAAWRAMAAQRQVLLCASTRDGEEQRIIAVLQQQRPGWLTIIVPRHPQRFDVVAGLISAAGLTMQRRSEIDIHGIAPDTDVLLGDSMGEMFAYYAACDAAFIGGSLLPLGGQNLIEACMLGKPVLIGPHTFNFHEISNQAEADGAALRVETAQDMIDRTRALFADPVARNAMSAQAAAFAAQHKGATERTVKLIASVL